MTLDRRIRVERETLELLHSCAVVSLRGVTGVVVALEKEQITYLVSALEKVHEENRVEWARLQQRASSYPYLDVALRTGASYGDVLAIADHADQIDDLGGDQDAASWTRRPEAMSRLSHYQMTEIATARHREMARREETRR